MIEHFKDTDLEITYSHWKSENKEKYFLFPPLTHLNVPLQGIQINSSGKISRLDFNLIEDEDKIIFHDIHSGKAYYFELDKEDRNKCHFSGQSGLKETWTRQPMDTVSEWLG
ncbi:hypothetical protein [Marinirhabdus gelatinilytica]|uniref:Uncharacterized protein n=1 Tax=Marinirhabdus gelatinilytica TaxID=1703343 RepID=A0A370QF36_9FLAO|nr:hypothetical protein [Marinirhabdus gelatinilytica]RDK86978.1 hypothetical protein C8D94_102156 [Marinirhabdus gelatinilytica]